MLISLIGYRGTGKTTVGHLLAERLGWTCVDTDLEVERVVGMSIRQIFDQLGEESFRQYEAQVVQELARRHKQVLALGGGAVLRQDNRRALSVAGPVVWLTATPETIGRRIADDPQSHSQRPDLTAAGGLTEIRQLLQSREPIYRQLADCAIATDDVNPREIVDRILAALDLSPASELS
jgi:shikimate kinase